jgi:hypothetical protein
VLRSVKLFHKHGHRGVFFKDKGRVFKEKKNKIYKQENQDMKLLHSPFFFILRILLFFLLCHVTSAVGGCVTTESLHTCPMLNGVALNTSLQVLSAIESSILNSLPNSNEKCASSNQTLSCWQHFSPFLCNPRKLCASMCFKKTQLCAVGQQMVYGSAQTFPCLDANVYSFLDDGDCIGEKLARVITLEFCFPQATNPEILSFNAATGYLAGILSTYFEIEPLNVRPVTTHDRTSKCIQVAFFSGDLASIESRLANIELKNFMFHYYRIYHVSNTSLESFIYTSDIVSFAGSTTTVLSIHDRDDDDDGPKPPFMDVEASSWGFWWAIAVMIPVVLFAFTCQRRKNVPDNGEQIELADGVGDGDDDDDDDDLEMCFEPKKKKEAVD